jgi:hypothetical protein
MACLKLLVALPTALGGEVAALVRERDPYHAVLKSALFPAPLLYIITLQIEVEIYKQICGPGEPSTLCMLPSSRWDSEEDPGLHMFLHMQMPFLPHPAQLMARQSDKIECNTSMFAYCLGRKV